MTYPEFYDSNPGPYDTVPGDYPKGASYAVLYADTSLEPGYRPQPNPGIPNVRYNTRRGGLEAAAYAGAIDFEYGNVAYVGNNLQQWAQGRAASRHRARVYCNRSDVAVAWPQVGHLPVEWWIATDDNNPGWNPDLIVASVRAIARVDLAPEDIWGIQWGTNNTFDTSYLTSEW